MKIQHFTGVISNYGQNHSGDGVTALTNIEDRNGYLATDHLWLEFPLRPIRGTEQKNINQIVSFLGKPVRYVRYTSQQEDFTLQLIGIAFYGVPVPEELSNQMIKKLTKHPNQYFAGIIKNHQLSFIGYDRSGNLIASQESVTFSHTITNLLALTKSFAHGQSLVVFKVIRYRNKIYFGLPSAH